MASPPKTIKLDQDKPTTQTPTQVITNQSQAKPTLSSSSQSSGQPLLKNMTINPVSSFSSTKALGMGLAIVLAGIVTGFGLSKATASQTARMTKSADQAIAEGLKVGDIIGNPDEKTFRDSAEGVIVAGGIEGEGSHHLIRPGGPSQSVYLTSSVLDLDELVDHQVKIWGETFAAQKAGWLMDVGRVQIQELNAEKPFDEEAAN